MASRDLLLPDEPVERSVTCCIAALFIRLASAMTKSGVINAKDSSAEFPIPLDHSLPASGEVLAISMEIDERVCVTRRDAGGRR